MTTSHPGRIVRRLSRRLSSRGRGQEAWPIIVYGAPRSETGYFSRVLNQHPDIHLTDEARLFRWMHEAVKILPERDHLLLHYRAEFSAHLRANLPDVIRQWYWQKARSRYWGDKNPHYAADRGCLETIAELFPGARFIHVIRDGRDVVSSILRKGWLNFEAAHAAWIRHVEIGCDFGRMQPPQRYLEVRYEDLIQHDETCAKETLEFLGIHMDREVSAFCQSQQQTRTETSEPTRDLRHGASSSLWRDSWDPKQQRRSMALLSPYLITFGYETETSLGEIRSAIDVAVERSEGTMS